MSRPLRPATLTCPSRTVVTARTPSHFTSNAHPSPVGMTPGVASIGSSVGVAGLVGLGTPCTIARTGPGAGTTTARHAGRAPGRGVRRTGSAALRRLLRRALLGGCLLRRRLPGGGLGGRLLRRALLGRLARDHG